MIAIAIMIAHSIAIGLTAIGDKNMIFRQLFDSESSTYTYLIADEMMLDAILVDSVIVNVDRELKLLKELGLTLKSCLETHIHADHVTGASKLRDATDCQVIVPENAKVTGADRMIQHGEVIKLGTVSVKAIATPGHTDSHMAYLVNGDRILTGDALLIRGCGRTDFQDGDAGILYDSIHQHLFSLPNETLVFPGHDYNGLTVSSIGEEKQLNPRFMKRSRSQFITLMEHLDLPMPKKIFEAVSANQACGSLDAHQP